MGIHVSCKGGVANGTRGPVNSVATLANGALPFVGTEAPWLELCWPARTPHGSETVIF